MASTYRQYFDDISPQDLFIYPTFYRYSYEVREEYDTDDPDYIFGYTLFIFPDRAPLLPKDLKKNIQFFDYFTKKDKPYEFLPPLEIEFSSYAGPPEEIIKLVKTYLQGGHNLDNLSTGNPNPNGFTYPKPGTPFPGSSPGSEYINTTHDKDYDYKKVIQKDGTVVYSFIGRRNEPKQRFPNWTEAVDDGSFGTIRRNAIIDLVRFDSPPNPNPPETSQTSNIIENSEDPNANNLYGTVVDEKTLEPIKGASVEYSKYSTTTDKDGKFIIELPSRKKQEPILLQECINTTHDSAYNYKRLTYSDGKVDYYFIGQTGKYKQNFPNWTEAPPNTLVGKTSGTINRDAIVEKVVFDCPPVKFEESSSLSNNIDTPPTPPQPLSSPTSQLRTITGEIQSPSDESRYGGKIRLVKNEVGDITDPPYQTITDFDGKFQLSVPIEGKFIQAKKIDSTQTIYLPLTQETNYVFDFTSQVNEGVIQEQVETTVTASRPNLEVSAVDYESKSIPVVKGDNTLKNNLGIIQLKTTKADLDKEIIQTATPTKEDVQTLTKDKKDFRWRLNQKLLDLLNKLKNILLPVILTMIAKFGVTKIQELIKEGKNNANDIQNKFCPPKGEIENIIRRKNKFVKQINNSLKLIDTTLKVLGIARSFITISLGIIRGIDIAQLALPTAIPGVTAGAITKVDDIKKFIQDNSKTTKQSIDGTIIILNLLRITLTQIVTYLNLLDSLIQDCIPDNEIEQEQISSELITLTQEQANQKSPVVTIVNGFTMGVETEKTTNSLKRRRATATNAGGVVMLKGEWSFSSIDQILIDELVFYIQINDLKAD
jgi:translation initiation factor 1 (eIF-1/SUI1)